ncbi:MAG: hypothetical protein ACTTKM_04935 [Prevotella fusca]
MKPLSTHQPSLQPVSSHCLQSETADLGKGRKNYLIRNDGGWIILPLGKESGLNFCSNHLSIRRAHIRLSPVPTSFQVNVIPDALPRHHRTAGPLNLHLSSQHFVRNIRWNCCQKTMPMKCSAPLSVNIKWFFRQMRRLATE